MTPAPAAHGAATPLGTGVPAAAPSPTTPPKRAAHSPLLDFAQHAGDACDPGGPHRARGPRW